MDKKSNEFQCKFCINKFKNFKNLANHLKKGCRKRDYYFKCPTCSDNVFSSFDPLSAILHVSKCIPKDNRVVNCPQCFANFPSKKFVFHYHNDMLKHHLSENEYKFACVVCGLKFPNGTYKNLHCKRHVTQDKIDKQSFAKPFTRYACSICLSSQFTHTKILDHMKNEHDLKIDKGIKKAVRKRLQGESTTRINGHRKVYACYVCEKRFHCRTMTRYHIRNCERECGYTTHPPTDDSAKYVQQLKKGQDHLEPDVRQHCDYCNADLSTLTYKPTREGHIKNCEKKYFEKTKDSQDEFFCPKCKRIITHVEGKEKHISNCK